MREDWINIELGDICEKAQKVKRNEKPIDEQLKYLDIGAIDNSLNRILSYKEYTWQNAPSRAQQIVKIGDVLFSTVRTYLKNIAQVKNELFDNEICSSGFTVIRGKKGVLDSNFMFYLSLSEHFIQPLNILQSGSSYPAVRDKDVFSQKINLPPLPEQRAIVAKIEELFSSLDSGIADLQKAQAQLKVFRQAVLKKAFEGDLTGVKLDTVEINRLGAILTGNTPSKKSKENYSSRDNNFYKPTDLNAGDNVIYSNDFLSKIGFENSRQVPEMSILVTCIGATIGKAGLIKEKGGFNQQINAIVPFEGYNPKFVYYQVVGHDFQTQIKMNASSTTLPIINKGKFSKLTMKICPLEEQHQIVQEIESRLSVCDKVEESILENLEKAKALRQSILKKAFEGKLLTEQELKACKVAPDYEPAEVLLERIKRGRNERIKESKKLESSKKGKV